MVLLYDKQITVFFDGQVPLFIAIIINNSVFGPVGAGMVPEIESPILKPVFRYPDFSAGIEVAEDASVFAENVVDRPHIPVTVGVEAVVVHAPALVGTEFFVSAAHHGSAAFQAVLDAVLFYHGGEFISWLAYRQQNRATENLMIFKNSFCIRLDTYVDV